MSSIFYHTQSAFAEKIFIRLGRGREHARALYAHFMQRGTLAGFAVEPQAGSLIEEMKAITDFSVPRSKVVQNQGGTVKFLTQIDGNLEVESVFIPMKSKNTLCISSQVGCKMGCAFCQTGRMGLLRQLRAEEIVVQGFIAKRMLSMQVDNLVFMGMGEPLDNLEAVATATEVLSEDSGLGFTPSKMTISTSGLVDKIDQMEEKLDPAIRLAVSLNAPNDQIRQKIMPVNAMWNMASLKGAMERFCSNKKRSIFIEYVLINEVNDSLECADKLADYLKGLNVKVNLIPYNRQNRDRFSPPSREGVKNFLMRMRSHGFLTFLREAKGEKIMAACGQLGNLDLRKLRKSAKMGLLKEP